MTLLSLPPELRLNIYDAVLRDLVEVPEHHDTYVLPEEWPKKSFADYHALLLTCREISSEIKHLFLTAYVDKITLFFDDCSKLYHFVERTHVPAEQGRRLQDMNISLRSPYRAISAWPDAKLFDDGLHACITNTVNLIPQQPLPADPVSSPMEYLRANGKYLHRGTARVLSAKFQTPLTGPSSLEYRGVSEGDEMLHFSTYVELRTTLSMLDWHNWVHGDSRHVPMHNWRVFEEQEDKLEKLREMFAAKDEHLGMDVAGCSRV